MRKIDNAELIEILAEKPKKQFMSILNDVKNYENKQHAMTGVCAYVGDAGELIIHEKYQIYQDHHVFFVVDPQKNTMDFLKSLTDEIAESCDSYWITCEDKSYFEDPRFSALYGEHGICHSVEYGMFEKKPYKKANKDLVIRRLTKDDGEIVKNFEEPVIEYRANLRGVYETYLKADDPNNVVYGGFLDGKLVSYLYANTFDRTIWDIGHIFTRESYRGRGIAADLANYYGAGVTDSGAFASYGSAANESSVRTALKAGFEEFDDWYRVYVKEENL